jgi:hypothetical protein
VAQEDGRIVALKKVEIFDMAVKKRERCLQVPPSPVCPAAAGAARVPGRQGHAAGSRLAIVVHPHYVSPRGHCGAHPLSGVLGRGASRRCSCCSR